MKVDFYRRPATGGDYAYLAVPSGQVIPNEATSLDWETVHSDRELDEQDYGMIGVGAEDLQEQINRKGYAISSVKNTA